MKTVVVLEYDKESPDAIIKIAPRPPQKEWEKIEHYWNNIVSRKILIALSEKEDLQFNLLGLWKKIGHSYSTTHTTVAKMEKDGLLSSEYSFKGAKQKNVRTYVYTLPKERYLVDGFKWYLRYLGARWDKSYEEAKERVYKKLEEKGSMRINEIMAATALERPVIQWVLGVEEDSQLKTEPSYGLNEEGIRWLEQRREQNKKKK